MTTARMKRPAAGATALVGSLALALAATAAGAGAAAAQAATAGPAAGAMDPAAVDSLVAAGRLQEAAWAARVMGDTARGDALILRLDSILRAPPVAARPLSMEQQGVSYTWRLGHGGGIESIFKKDGSDIFCPECGAGREVAAYRIDRLLGFDLTPVTVFTQVTDDDYTLTGSTQYFVNGASEPEEVGATKPDRLRLFDAILGNSDRHETNWLVLESGRVVAIDHNRAFDYTPSPRARTCWEREIDALERPADLGAPYDRYRALSDDELAAAVDGLLEPELAARFVAMRDRIVARIDGRVRRPAAEPVYEDCVPPEAAPSTEGPRPVDPTGYGGDARP